MALSSILGGSAFGLACRFWQLGLQKRNLFDNLSGHGIGIVAGGFVGYWVGVWDNRAVELIAMKKQQIEESRAKPVEADS